jgi:hypothetical protein
MKLTDEQIAAIRDGTEGVTPGPWEADTTKSDGCYGGGEDCHEGYQTSVLLDAKGERIADALNSDCGQVSEEYDEDGCYAWDEVAKRNFAHIARCDPDTIRALATEVLESRAEIAAKDARIAELEGALATEKAERGLLQDVLDSRPAINAGLPETYIRWSQAVYSGDFARAALGRNAT